MPLVTDLFHAQMKVAGKVVNHHLSEHFAYSRTELFTIIKANQLKSFADVLQHSVLSGAFPQACLERFSGLPATRRKRQMSQQPFQRLWASG